MKNFLFKSPLFTRDVARGEKLLADVRIAVLANLFELTRVVLAVHAVGAANNHVVGAPSEFLNK